MKGKVINSISALIIAIGVIFFQYLDQDAPVKSSVQAGAASSSQSKPVAVSSGQVEDLFAQRKSDVIVELSARVIKILPDDLEGSKHQKFIVKLQSGHTLLVSHNIDLAPRVNELRENDQIRIKGEYEWSARGGVVHWTHHDPRGRHEGGWLEHEGKRYE